MKLFDVLRLHDDSIRPEMCKLHLAGWNGFENPVDVFVEGRFEAWQSRQSRKNFGRPLVVSLIAMDENHHWLFAGVHDVHGHEFVAEWDAYRYEMTSRATAEAVNGRLVVRFERTGRQSYLLAEKWTDNLVVSELLPRRLQVGAFPGFVKVRLTKGKLDAIVGDQPALWKSALSSVAGVYVIADSASGKLYVGSATGEAGIWGRWCSYSKTGHGGNRELVALLREKGEAYASNFVFGVLETADTRASESDVLGRESHWKELLLSRVHGYNAN
ncbi:MAG: GIY-YIG nuclease family protein [Nannocystales bacterium]